MKLTRELAVYPEEHRPVPIVAPKIKRSDPADESAVGRGSSRFLSSVRG
jgi:hypothetical protein